MPQDPDALKGKAKNAGGVSKGVPYYLGLLTMFEIILMVSALQPNQVQEIYKTEVKMMGWYDAAIDFGMKSFATREADWAYQTFIKKTGREGELLNLSASADQQSNLPWEVRIFSVFGDRARVWLLEIYLIFMRLAGISLWLPIFGLSLFGAFVDGGAMRRVTGWRFDRRDATKIKAGKSFCASCAAMVFVYLFCPMPFPPMVVPLCLIGFVVIAHFVRKKLQTI